MRIGLADIDARIAESFVARVRALWERPAQLTEPEKAAAEALRRRVDRAARWFHLFDWALPSLTFFGGPFVAAGLWQVDPAFGVAAGAATSAAFGGALWRAGRLTDPRKHLEEYILREEMGTVFPLLDLSPAERAYGDALLVLTDLDRYMDEATGRRLLGRMNDLLGSYRELEARRVEVAAALGENTAAALTAQREDLKRQEAETSDPAAREAIRHSIRMCEARGEDARTFEMTRDRLKAQQEAVLQTLSSTHSALTRMKLTPRDMSAPDLARLQEDMDDLTSRTRAVEQAVQEVMALRSG